MSKTIFFAIFLIFGCSEKKHGATAETSSAALTGTSSSSSNAGSFQIHFEDITFTKVATVMPGHCTTLLVFLKETQTGYGSPEPIYLSSSSPTGQFYSGKGCTTPTPPVAIVPPGDDGAPLFYQDGAIGSATLSIKDVGRRGLAGVSVNIIQANPTNLEFYTKTVTGTVGACVLVTVSLKNDAGEFVAPATDTDIAITTSSKSSAFYQDEACTQVVSKDSVVDGQSTSNGIYFKATIAGVEQWTATTKAITAVKDATLQWKSAPP